MLKKAIAGSVTALLVGGLVFGKDIFSYATTACSNVRDAVKSEIAPEFELDRIRNEITKLQPEIDRHMTIVAEQKVDVKDLERQISTQAGKLQDQKAVILARRSQLNSSGESVTYRQVSYSRGEAEADLAVRFDAFRTGEEGLARDRQILEAQKKTLAANQRKLDSMVSRKQELRVHVSQLEARLKTIQATEAVNAIELDDTRLSEVEGMIKDLNRELDVRESVLETKGNVISRIPDDGELPVATDNVVTEIDRHFGLVSEESVAEVDVNSSL